VAAVEQVVSLHYLAALAVQELLLFVIWQHKKLRRK
jgi:hypothetical protein